MQTKWLEKPYHSLDYDMKRQFSQKVYRISLDAGMTCPNRDGTIGTKGCLFCSEAGSGDFAGDADLSITHQLDQGIKALSGKRPVDLFIAYFQAFTNTYAPISYLEKIYTEAIAHPRVAILSIATRPDCISPETVTLLSRLNKLKPIWVELGLQTIHEETARIIRRGFPLSVYEKAVSLLRNAGIPVITHCILYLPGETLTSMEETIRFLNTMDIQGIKLHLLHILKHTDLADYYTVHPFYVPEMEEYIHTVCHLLTLLRPDITIHRLTGDGPSDLLIAPLFSKRKRDILNGIHHYMKEQQLFQGQCYFQ